MPLIPISCSSVSCCRRCLRCAKRERTGKRCSFCSAVSCWRLLLRCSRWIWSWRSRSRGVSVINLPGRGFGATCCAYVSIAITWKLCFTCILGDPGAVSRVDKMFVVKVYCKIETSPWALTLTEPVPEACELPASDWPAKTCSDLSAKRSCRVTLVFSYTT